MLARRIAGLVIVCGLLVPFVTHAADTSSVPKLIDTIPATVMVSLSDQRVVVGAGTHARFTVVCFLGTECPLAKLYGPRLQRLTDKFSAHNVTFVGVISNHQDSLEESRQYASLHDLRFPIVKDSDQRLADLFQATRTPEVVVVDAVGAVRYRGRIDDQYQPGVARDAPTTNDLSDALEALLAGRAVPNERTEPIGCAIGRSPRAVSQVDGPVVTYAGEVSRLLAKHCVECHREGQIGPFAMDDYDEVAGWAMTMLETIDDKRMPPWHAAPPHDRFLGARWIAQEERDLLARWIDQGMPKGDLNQLPEPKPFLADWSLPNKPDAIFEMAREPMEIPADGTVEYQYFVVDPGFEEDRWVKAAQVVPGNPSVVHHAICFIRPPDGAAFRGVGWLGAYVPGQQPAELREGMARMIPAGSKLVFQMHYTPTGKSETDLTRVGIVFADAEQVDAEVLTLLAIDQSFEIPAGAEAHAVYGSVNRFPQGGKLLSLMPHMHYRGKAFSVSLRGKNADEEILLDVPRYDFNWQHDYRLREPIDLQEIESLEFTALFDNSAKNPANPDPTQAVYWGDQTWEEMAVAFFDVTRPLTPQAGSTYDSTAVEPASDLTERRKIFVDEFLQKLDRDHDGLVRREETPESFRAFAFWRFDTNDDGAIARDELEGHAERRIR